MGKNIPQLQQSPPGTPPQAAPLGRKLSVSASVAGEDGLYSCVLPEDLLVEILAERMQVCFVSYVVGKNYRRGFKSRGLL